MDKFVVKKPRLDDSLKSDTSQADVLHDDSILFKQSRLLL